MKANTSSLGEQDINPETVLTFPRGLYGFENYTRYQLLHEEADGAVVYYMQSIDDPAIAFSVVDPSLFGFNYELSLSDEEVELLHAGESPDLAVLLMVYKPQGADGQQVELKGGVTANINGPLVINLVEKLGFQKVLVGPQVDIVLRENKGD